MSDAPTYPIRWHDHDPGVVALPEYHEARRALDRLVHAMRAADIALGGQEPWIDMAGDFASTNIYGDHCSGRRAGVEHDDPMTYPHLTEPSGETGLRAHYRCPTCGHTWTTHWAIDQPDLG